MSTPATAESRSSTISATSLLPGSGWVAGKPANAAGEAVWRSRREVRRLRSGGPHGDPFLFQPWRRPVVMFGDDEQIFAIQPDPVPRQDTSEGRRGGDEGVRTCRFWGLTVH